MPENNRTPSKFAQVAPAHSGQNTPSIRNSGDHPAETKDNLKKDVLQDPNVFPTLDGFAQEVEHEKEEHELHQRGISGDSPSNSKPVSRQDSTKEEEWIDELKGRWAKEVAPLPDSLKVSDLKQERSEGNKDAARKENNKGGADDIIQEKKGAEGSDQRSEAEHRAWQGKIPTAVKQPGEFRDAKTTIIDESASLADRPAKNRKQEREQGRPAHANRAQQVLGRLKRDVRETALERAFVKVAAAVIGLALVIADRFLRLLGLRAFVGHRLDDGRHLLLNVYQKSGISTYGEPWGPYRWLTRMIAAVDSRSLASIGVRYDQGQQAGEKGKKDEDRSQSRGPQREREADDNGKKNELHLRQQRK